jgi:hypothetical protein
MTSFQSRQSAGRRLRRLEIRPATIPSGPHEIRGRDRPLNKDPVASKSYARYLQDPTEQEGTIDLVPIRLLAYHWCAS